MGFSLPFGQNFLSQGKSGDTAKNRPITTTNSFARVVVFHYKRQSFPAVNFGSFPKENDVFLQEVVVIEDEITSVNVSKQLGAAAGSFEVEMLPARNFKKMISPGDWALVYLYNGAHENIDPKNIPNENIVMVGNVDRIHRTRRRNEDSDKLETRFVISGRDHGKVFAETDLFFNPYIANSQNAKVIEAMLVTKGLLLSGSPDTLTNSILDVFISSSGAALTFGSLKGQKTEPINQWKIPRDLFNVLNKGSESFGTNLTSAQGFPTGAAGASSPTSIGDSLFRNVTKNLPGFKQRSFLTTRGNGNLWSLLEQNSNPMVNEMFTEIDRGPVSEGSKSGGPIRLAFFLRPRPNSPLFKFTPQANFVSSLNGAFTDLNEIAQNSAIVITQDQIQYDNLGKDGRTRFNMLWQTPKLTGDAKTNEYANVQPYIGTGPSLPMLDTASVQMYGLKKLQPDLDFAYETNSPNVGSVQLQKQFMNQVYDMHRFNHMYETGTISTNGLYVEIGRVLKVTSTKFPSLPPKLYYIEGYDHEWSFPNRWTTTMKVTRGQYETNGTKQASFIDSDEADDGLEDIEFTQSHLVKTNVPRGPTGSSSTGPSGFTFGGKEFKF